MNHHLPRPPFDPELQQFLDAADDSGRAIPTPDMLAQMRRLDVDIDALDRGLRARGLERSDATVPGYQGEPIRLALIGRIGRTGARPCFYTIHGGGMMFGHYLGNLDGYDEWLLNHDVLLASIDYRLAPEHPYPVPVEDCYAGLVWAAEHAADLGIDPERMVLAGSSAGGGLAAASALLARDRKGPALLGQVLVSPMLDDTADTVSAHQIDGVGVADRGFVRHAWDAYLAGRHGAPAAAAPARAEDLSDLPETYIDCGSAEVFRDESVAYASRLWAAGNATELHVWAGAFHGFTGIVPHAAISRTAVKTLAAWVDRLLDRHPSTTAGDDSGRGTSTARV